MQVWSKIVTLTAACVLAVGLTDHAEPQTGRDQIGHAQCDGLELFTLDGCTNRAAFQRVGPFSVDLRIGEFIEWHARAVELETPMALIPEVLLQRRIHASNSGVALREARLDYVRVIKAAIDRRRQKLKQAR
jgi:hypothetical protein